MMEVRHTRENTQTEYGRSEFPPPTDVVSGMVQPPPIQGDVTLDDYRRRAQRGIAGVRGGPPAWKVALSQHHGEAILLTQALIAIVDRGDRLLDMLQLKLDRLLGEPWHLDAIDLDALGIEQR